MSRFLIVFLVFVAACSSDSSSGQNPKPDASTPADSGFDAAVKPLEPLVFEAGSPCESEADCMGPSPTCMTMLSIPMGPPQAGMGGMARDITFPGGYCTANCTSSKECGSGSECGVAELIETLQPILASQGVSLPMGGGGFAGIPSQCLDVCQATSGCRDGYSCQTILDAAGFASQIPFPIPAQKYCLPAMPGMSIMDAGIIVTDSGMMTADDAGM